MAQDEVGDDVLMCFLEFQRLFFLTFPSSLSHIRESTYSLSSNALRMKGIVESMDRLLIMNQDQCDRAGSNF
jgi:hypothetical protein